MRKLIVVLLALVLAALGNPIYAAEPTLWSNWGAAPYARNLKESCLKASAAIDGFNMPSAVKEHFKSVLGTTCKDGVETWLSPGLSLKQMWSGPDAHHKKAHIMDEKSVAELPVLRSPDGRPYRKGAVAETAKALVWVFAYEGKTYVLYNPFVCFNWAWTIASPVAPIKKCVELSFNAPIGGYVRWGIGTTTGPIPPDECNAQRQGDGLWTSWYGECDICIPALGYIRGILGGTALVPHKYLYPVTHTRQTLRFSTEIWTKLVYICLEDASGKQSCGVYMRPQDWKGRYRVEIPDSMWNWDDTNCPQ